ncbi:Vacuolar protein sorting-associated protein 8 homolog [Eumeta japonica]|uniref:Vacuolar protein sorting-associated protein 8 homolog n=1 Tax=Eumeta variegata TaxID=151549 RepID=A0A4C1U0T1_EUMVA|nr:Vacuolar protein sorting-associated protein 8 homolog [Eumeta japonica]
MSLLKTPSVQSLLDSDLGSIESLQSLDIEELDETEYAIPPSETPSLAEALLADEENSVQQKKDDNLTCSALQIELLQGVSQQLLQAEERSSAGPATTLSMGVGGRLAVGTAHGHILSFQDQVLRWVCDANVDRGAASCLAYNEDGSRLLVGFARGLICQYESSRGLVLRRVSPGGEMWGALHVAWAGTSGLALDTGGSVWLIKFSRPLGVRAARTSCLFSGARGEVVSMAARDARMLALATLSRVITVAGGRAASVRFAGPPHALPVLAWSEADGRIIVCARAHTLQWLLVTVSGTSISLKSMRQVTLKASPLWIGWLDGRLGIFDVNEKLRLWEEDYGVPLDLSPYEPVYASALFKGVWTDGRVSRAMSAVGVSAPGGASAAEGALAVLGRRGVVCVRPRDVLARVRVLANANHYAQALRLLATSNAPEVRRFVYDFITNLYEMTQLTMDKDVAEAVIAVCSKHALSEELWGRAWENWCSEPCFVEALGEAVVRGLALVPAPTPDVSQALVERLAEKAPDLLEAVVAALPLTSLDPHRASIFARDRGMWRTVGAIAAMLGGTHSAMRELTPWTRSCRAGGGDVCSCAGDALLLLAADGLAGRGPAGRVLPEHARPSARHDALQVLLNEEAKESGEGKRAPLHALVQHDARAAVRLLEQSAREPPFVGPLGKQNRLRVARALLSWTDELQVIDKMEILEFISSQLKSGSLPAEAEVTKSVRALAANVQGERADRAWLALLERPATRGELAAQLADAAGRPLVLWHLYSLLDRPEQALAEFFNIVTPTDTDIEQLFEYLHSKMSEIAPFLERYLLKLMELRPRTVAAIALEHCPESISDTLRASNSYAALEFAETLLEAGHLQGDTAAAHLKNLCAMRPENVLDFLSLHVGLIRPEDALRIVKEMGPRDAEPFCLEVTGDPEAALNVMIDLFRGSKDHEQRVILVKKACELCARVAPSVPATAAATMWSRVLQLHESVPASALLEAVAYLPLDALVDHACNSSQIALALMRCAASKVMLCQSTMRILDRELHETLVRALRRKRHAVSVQNARCGQCGGGLAACGPARTCGCGRAHHVACVTDGACAVCGRMPAQLYNLPARPHRRHSPFLQHNLILVAPPRPDLEGVV